MCAGVTVSDFCMAVIWDGSQHFVRSPHDSYFFSQTDSHHLRMRLLSAVLLINIVQSSWQRQHNCRAVNEIFSMVRYYQIPHFFGKCKLNETGNIKNFQEPYLDHFYSGQGMPPLLWLCLWLLHWYRPPRCHQLTTDSIVAGEATTLKIW